MSIYARKKSDSRTIEKERNTGRNGVPMLAKDSGQQVSGSQFICTGKSADTVWTGSKRRLFVSRLRRVLDLG